MRVYVVSIAYGDDLSEYYEILSRYNLEVINGKFTIFLNGIGAIDKLIYDLDWSIILTSCNRKDYNTLEIYDDHIEG